MTGMAAAAAFANKGNGRATKAALEACEAYFEERADAEYFADSASPTGNEEMRLLVEVRQALGKRS